MVSYVHGKRFYILGCDIGWFYLIQVCCFRGMAARTYFMQLTARGFNRGRSPVKFNQGEERVGWIDTGQALRAIPFFIRIAHRRFGVSE